MQTAASDIIEGNSAFDILCICRYMNSVLLSFQNTELKLVGQVWVSLKYYFQVGIFDTEEM